MQKNQNATAASNPEVIELTNEVGKFIELGQENTSLWEFHQSFEGYHYIIAKLACSYITDPAGALKDHGLLSEDDIE